MHDLRRLRAFHAVAERRSFSEAALALGYAQSVVSHHVAALEQEFGLTLVDRRGGRSGSPRPGSA
jgi:DNA-binding transcriptional LysR family regulator